MEDLRASLAGCSWFCPIPLAGARETNTSLHAPFTLNAVPMTMNRIFETLSFPLIIFFYNDSL